MRYRELTEEFFDAYKKVSGISGKTYVELFKQPTKSELLALDKTSGDFIRGFLTNDSLFVWNAYNALHYEIAHFLKLSSTNDVGIYLSYSPTHISVVVTDFVKLGSKWYHNPNLKDWIINHPGWNTKAKIEVDYFDSAIVGDWADLPDYTSNNNERNHLVQLAIEMHPDRTEEDIKNMIDSLTWIEVVDQLKNYRIAVQKKRIAA